MSDFAGKTALVVDDENAQLEFMSAILDDAKVKTISAGNGKEAMRKMNEAIPDIIFLDLMMPEQSGMKFFFDLKQNSEFMNIPVVVVSGASKVTGVDLKSIIYDKEFSDRKKKIFGTDAAPDAYIEKPVDPQKIIDVLNEYLAD